MKPRFISSADANRKCMMYSKSACEIIMIGNDTGAVNYNFDYVSEMHYICNKITLNHGESYIDSSKWIKSKEQLNLTMKNQNKIWR